MRFDMTTFTCDRDGQTVEFNDPLEKDDELQEELTRRGWRVVGYGIPLIHQREMAAKSPGMSLLCRDCARDVAEFLASESYVNWHRDGRPVTIVSQSNDL